MELTKMPIITWMKKNVVYVNSGILNLRHPQKKKEENPALCNKAGIRRRRYVKGSISDKGREILHILPLK